MRAIFRRLLLSNHGGFLGTSISDIIMIVGCVTRRERTSLCRSTMTQQSQDLAYIHLLHFLRSPEHLAHPGERMHLAQPALLCPEPGRNYRGRTPR
jgi:hypothetical protein